MWAGKCRSLLCPVSLGLAIGITMMVLTFICLVWMMYYGGAPSYLIMAIKGTDVTWKVCFVYALFGLLKGFVFGFIVALLYDLFASKCNAVCCKSEGACGECGCVCGPSGKPVRTTKPKRMRR